ncbi:MAG: stilbene synthase, partial [Verrucomicrobiota bacterium]
DVLMALQNKLNLSPTDICWSAAILREFGNLSSPFVLFVLEKALRENAPGGFWWLASFGAGFSSHGALLEVE